MRGELFDEIVSINIKDNQKAIALNQKSHFGKLEGDILELSLIEGCYLLEKSRLKIYFNDEKIAYEFLISLIRDKGLYGKYIVFRDLKDRGYIIKAGFKYGSEFRLYERGKSPGDGHSHYLVKIIYEFEDLKTSNLSSYARVAHGVKKSLILAVIDEDKDITYYTLKWMKP
ncbi:MAG: tRNA-intron lyase [Methanobrevibacter sp.]|jgi:tRNA-intron endonuclease|nr:tRNA-intron lyase [Methanobrevibacter sp.]